MEIQFIAPAEAETCSELTPGALLGGVQIDDGDA